MADEQTPQSDLIDDAIRQAERQLEAKLEALRMSAMSAATPAPVSDDAEIAILRPTGGPVASTPEPAMPAPAAGDWQEQDGDDLMFTPTSTSGVSLDPVEAYVPDTLPDVFEQQPALAEPAAETAPTSPVAEGAAEMRATSVTGLTPVWDDESDDAGDAFDAPLAAVEPVAELPETPAWEPQAGDEQQPYRDEPEWDRPEPVHTSWTAAPIEATAPEAPAPVWPTIALEPSDSERAFWRQTQRALHSLQELAQDAPSRIADDVRSTVGHVTREAIAPTEGVVRELRQELGDRLPKLAERVEDALAPTTETIAQMRDELPVQIEQAAEETRTQLREGFRTDLDTASATTHLAIQQDVALLEQSIATNVTRMAQGTTDAVERIEHDLDLLSSSVTRFERGMSGEFDRIETQLRSSIEQTGRLIRDDLGEPAEAVRKLERGLQGELSNHFDQIQRTLGEDIRTVQKELGDMVSGLVVANRAGIDRITAAASSVEEDRTRRAEDIELVVDTVTTGWEALGAAVKALYEQNQAMSERLTSIERLLVRVYDQPS